jgi:hypothetical protein
MEVHLQQLQTTSLALDKASDGIQRRHMVKICLEIIAKSLAGKIHIM